MKSKLLSAQTSGFKNIAQRLLLDNLDRRADKIAYLCEGNAVSYRHLAEGVYRFAALLRRHGIVKGDRVMLVLLDSPVFVAAFLGTALHGAMAVPVSTALTENDYRQILEDSGARILVVSTAVVPAVAFPAGAVPRIVCGEDLNGWLPDQPAVSMAPTPVNDSDFAFMLYTSGSTGRLKGVPHRHQDLLVAAEQYAVKVVGMREDDLFFSTGKLFFGYGLGNSLAFPLYLGATALLHPGKALASDLIALIERYRPTVFFSVPTIFSQIIRSVPENHLSLPTRLCISAGEALPAAIFHEWRRLTGQELLDGIGSTEFFHIFISNRPGQAVPGSAGQPVPGYEPLLVDDNGDCVPSGVPGHLLIRGPSAAPCYWHLPDKTNATMLANGFIRTGDIFVEKDNCYYHQGRSDDMLKCGGQWVSPIQVEDVIRGHPIVADCAVAASVSGGLQRPAAFIVLRPGVEPSPQREQEIRSFLAGRLLDFMRPICYTFVDVLPRTPTGKLQRFKLKKGESA